MSGETELFTLLKEVSRSFYISVRCLPRRIRMPIALGYLLARASDTIADTNQLPPGERIAFLKRFLRSISGGQAIDPLALSACLAAQADGPEKVLMANIGEVLEYLSNVTSVQRGLLTEVLTKIIYGQTLDIERFESGVGISGLPDESALEEYTYLVAGCVGEFWTKICLLEWPHYARRSPEEMLESGIVFGKGLQLVNILRDYPLDLQAGRSYLPVPNLEQVELHPALARPEWERWRRRASGYLEEAWKYAIAVRPFRVRFACAVPIFIGVRTLRLLDEAADNRAGVKVTRKEVRRLVAWAVGMALFRFLEPLAYRTIFRR